MTFYSTKPAISSNRTEPTHTYGFHLNHSLSHHTKFNCPSPIYPIASPWSISLPNIVLILTELPNHSTNSTIILARFYEFLPDFPNALICYTDGSPFKNRVGAANLISVNLCSFQLRNSAFVFTAELQAIFQCPQTILLHPPQLPYSLIIVTDSLFSCLLYTSPSPRDRTRSRMPSSA